MSIRIEGLPRLDANFAITSAFKEIELVHRLMSFHEPESDVSRLNRDAKLGPIQVHPCSFDVLIQAIALSAATNACFDISVGAELVGWGWLPRPTSCAEPLVGTWRDIELSTERTVRFHRPLWIDLGGIAKGYAVDRAVACLRGYGVVDGLVNAGGDIRVLGQESEPIALGLDFPAETIPVIELTDGSIASSSNHSRGVHFDGTHRTPASTKRFVCVLAESCMVADALTKVVMARGLLSIGPLRRFGAAAHLFEAGAGWQAVNCDADWA